ncbi:MAG: protein kinase [Terracidiphilus sp.]
MPLAANARLGHYQIKSVLGTSGTGVVYRAYDESREQTVAIKVLSPGPLDGQAAQERFRREARALTLIRHPNIGALYEVGSENGADYLVMEDIPGITLEERIQAGPLPIAEVLSLAIQVCEGLQAAHEKGIVHRDLKPGSLRLTPDGSLKIFDFSLVEPVAAPALAEATASQVGETSGAITYMAPEQLQGQPADLRSDVWAVGAVLYELSTGRRPFPGNVSLAIAADIIHKQPEKPRSLRSEIPVGLEEIILKCLEKDPSNRYASARAVAEDLEELRDGTIQAQQLPALGPPSETRSMEIAHVLFTDIVSYSTMPMDEQDRVLCDLQGMVRSNREFVAAQAEDRLIRLPTGDGMALVFFRDAEAPVRCAIELARGLREHHPTLKLRMGINSGPVYQVADINANRNVAGSGINMAQRVMDCGDAGHILLSKPVADMLAQVTSWRPALRDLGEAQVKHGVRVHIFNLCKDGAGNPEIPKKLRTATTRRRISLAAVIALVLGVAFASWLLIHFGRIGPGKSARKSIAVLGFRNVTGNPTAMWMSTALSEELTTELAAGEQLHAISGEDVTSAQRDLNLPEGQSLSQNTLDQLRKRLGSDLVVMGSYYDINGQIRVDIRLQDTSGGGTIANLSEQGSEFSDIVSRLGTSLRARCGVRDLTAAQSANVRAALPANTEAAQLYAEGLERLREFDTAGAREKFEATVAADPNNALAHSALSSAWSQLGYDSKAAEEAKKAFDLSGNLSREDRLTIEGAYHVADKQWDKAIAAYQTLFGLFPDNLEYGLALIDAQISGSKAQDALAIVSKIRQGNSLKARKKADYDDPRIDLAEARAAAALSDYRRSQAAAGRAAEAAVRQGARLERGQALLQQCIAFRHLGQFDDAKSAGRQAQEIFVESRYARGQALSLTCVANVLEDQGDLVNSQQMLEKALSLAQGIGARIDIAGALNNLGELLSERGLLEESNARYQQALSAATEIGDRDDEVKAQSNLGVNLITLGQFREAQKPLEGSLAIARAIGNQQGEVESLINLGTVSYSLGDLAKSEQQLDDALKMSRSLGLRADSSSALSALGDVMLAEDKLSDAEDAYHQSLEISEQLKESDNVAGGKLSIAALALERGDLANSETMAREVAKETQALGNSEQEMAAHNLLARTLTSQGKLDAASAELKAASQLGARDETSKLEWSINTGRLLARQGKKSDAIQVLKQAQAHAEAMGYVPGQFQARLALIEAGIDPADPTRTAREVRGLIQDATKLRFQLIARKAQEAERRKPGANSPP